MERNRKHCSENSAASLKTQCEIGGVEPGEHDNMQMYFQWLTYTIFFLSDRIWSESNHCLKLGYVHRWVLGNRCFILPNYRSKKLIMPRARELLSQVGRGRNGGGWLATTFGNCPMTSGILLWCLIGVHWGIRHYRGSLDVRRRAEGRNDHGGARREEQIGEHSWSPLLRVLKTQKLVARTGS